MADEDIFLIAIVVLAVVGGFALAMAGFLTTIGVPPDISGDLGMVLFFGIILVGGYKLLFG